MKQELQNKTSGDGHKIQELYTVDGQKLRELVEAALTWLKTNQQLVNSLNVFPVPDGDTGTNMFLTMQAAYTEVNSSGESNVGKMAHAVAQGALMGARGNSGVILSQIWRGFARVLDSYDVMDAAMFVHALAEAKNTAYKGVVRPVEGTILTVIKDVASSAEAAIQETKDIKIILEKIVATADESVKNTPELLPILKQAGVVDSGGKGLFILLEGMLRYLNGQQLETTTTVVQPLSTMNLEDTMETIEPGQDIEIVFDFKPKQALDLEKFYNELSELGTSIQLGEGDGMYRLHIHVPNENKYKTMEYVDSVGIVTKAQVENLLEQLENIEKESRVKINLTPIEAGQVAVVVVSPGDGISRIFASLGASAIVSGGQTMNPSTEEILTTIENLQTEKIIILPNNKNIILAAKNAASMTVKKVRVIPSISVPQGMSAMLRYDPDGDLEEIESEMAESLKEVETGEITTATRSIDINGISVQQGQVIALHNGKLIESASTLQDACLGFLKKAGTPDKERITLFYGNNIAKTEVNSIVDSIRSDYPSHEIELHEGGQPHYQFIISIE